METLQSCIKASIYGAVYMCGIADDSFSDYLTDTNLTFLIPVICTDSGNPGYDVTRKWTHHIHTSLPSGNVYPGISTSFFLKMTVVKLYQPRHI